MRSPFLKVSDEHCHDTCVHMRILNGSRSCIAVGEVRGAVPYLIIVAVHQLLYEEFDHRQGKVF